MIIQLVGLPCSGKTTLIKKAIANNFPIKHYDIVNESSENNYSDFFYRVINDSKHSLCIVESALGFSELPSIVILYKPNKKQYEANMRVRKEYFSLSDQQQLNDQIMPAQYTVYTQKNFEKILNIYLKEKI